MEHQPLEDTRYSFFFQCAEATTPRDQGYGMRIMFYPVSMTLSSTPGLLNVRLSLRS